MTVHNHGTEEGPGLACPERRVSDGSLRGKCMDARFENFPVRGRNGGFMGKVVGVDDEGRMHLVLGRETSETIRMYVEEGLIDSLTLYLLTMASNRKMQETAEINDGGSIALGQHVIGSFSIESDAGIKIEFNKQRTIKEVLEQGRRNGQTVRLSLTPRVREQTSVNYLSDV